MNLQAIVDDLQQRVARLEATRPRRRVFNLLQAAQFLGMSASKFRLQYVQTGRVKGVRDGGRIWRFTQEALEELLAAEQAEGDGK